MLKSISIKRTLTLLFLQASLYFLALFLTVIQEVSPIVKEWDSLIYNHVFVEDLDLSGKTLDEARSSLQKNYMELIQNKVIFVHAGPKTYTLSLDQVLKGNNLEAIIKEALYLGKEDSLLLKYQYIKHGFPKKYTLSLEYDEKIIKRFVHQIASSLNSEVKNAQIIQKGRGKLEVIPSQAAYSLDEPKLISLIQTALSQKITENIAITAPITEVQPQYTTEYMAASTTKIASFSTSFPHTPDGRTENIRLSAEAINGTLLMPGDVFSFNETVGETTLEKGYKMAPVISNGTITQGLGGGICQVSSTLYNAILRTGLCSLERRPHSKISTYVPIGLDATVSYGTIDYKFKNTFNYPLYIEAYTDASQIYITVYSHSSLSGKDYRIENDVYQLLPSPVTYRYDSSLSPTDRILVQKGTIGYKAKSYRKLYTNNQLVSTEEIADDIYRPSPTIYRTGFPK
ncbi:VanW family protein [Sporanaerobium hydrogeniformans]|uniref:VanW family protein n=1 Tax=Sporanaerobium hydrogeniformans TaxID=3072179 RepID=UPI0015D4AC4A|nr:VanW family protein [Sporanaerobium hydrogeniformans]